MRILIDIGHPGQVHYFKNFIKIMKKNNHEFLIVARDKEVTQILLQKYDIDFVSRGKGKKSLIGKMFYALKADLIIYKLSRKWKPDLLMSFGSPYIAHVSKLIGKPHIALTDTEHASLGILAFAPFTKTIITPECFTKSFSDKQVRFNGYFELGYLTPKYFKPDSSILDVLNLKHGENYIILRFVSWKASHDVGQSGLNIDMKRKIVNELSKYAKVFISSEGELPDDLKKHQIRISPERMHDALAFATLFVGEGATMASECACLGTPAIYVNSLEVGYCTEEENKYNLILGYRNSDGVLESAIELLKRPNLKAEFQEYRKNMLEDKIDVTAFLVWFVENYPKSINLMKDKSSYQNVF